MHFALLATCACAEVSICHDPGSSAPLGPTFQSLECGLGDTERDRWDGSRDVRQVSDEDSDWTTVILVGRLIPLDRQTIMLDVRGFGTFIIDVPADKTDGLTRELSRGHPEDRVACRVLWRTHKDGTIVIGTNHQLDLRWVGFVEDTQNAKATVLTSRYIDGIGRVVFPSRPDGRPLPYLLRWP